MVVVATVFGVGWADLPGSTLTNFAPAGIPGGHFDTGDAVRLFSLAAAEGDCTGTFTSSCLCGPRTVMLPPDAEVVTGIFASIVVRGGPATTGEARTVVEAVSEGHAPPPRLDAEPAGANIRSGEWTEPTATVSSVSAASWNW